MSVLIPPTSIVEVELAVQGMTCGACAARIEKKLNELHGVEAAVNYATETAMVAFDGDAFSEVQIITAIESVGFGARVVDDEPFDDDLEQRLRRVRFRLLVSGALTVPVVLLSMVPAFMFDGWQWWAMALSAPVVTWGAWPFHVNAIKSARHGTSTMDTLISVGIIAATIWSVWAVVWGDALEAVGHHSMMSSSSSHVYFEVGATVAAFILLGRYLEMRAKKYSRRCIALSHGLGCKVCKCSARWN